MDENGSQYLDKDGKPAYRFLKVPDFDYIEISGLTKLFFTYGDGTDGTSNTGEGIHAISLDGGSRAKRKLGLTRPAPRTAVNGDNERNRYARKLANEEAEDGAGDQTNLITAFDLLHARDVSNNWEPESTTDFVSRIASKLGKSQRTAWTRYNKAVEDIAAIKDHVAKTRRLLKPSRISHQRTCEYVATRRGKSTIGQVGGWKGKTLLNGYATTGVEGGQRLGGGKGCNCSTEPNLEDVMIESLDASRAPGTFIS